MAALQEFASALTTLWEHTIPEPRGFPLWSPTRARCRGITRPRRAKGTECAQLCPCTPTPSCFGPSCLVGSCPGYENALHGPLSPSSSSHSSRRSLSQGPSRHRSPTANRISHYRCCRSMSDPDPGGGTVWGRWLAIFFGIKVHQSRSLQPPQLSPLSLSPVLSACLSVGLHRCGRRSKNFGVKSPLSLTSSEILDKLLTLWNPIFIPVKCQSQWFVTIGPYGN